MTGETVAPNTYRDFPTDEAAAEYLTSVIPSASAEHDVDISYLLTPLFGQPVMPENGRVDVSNDRIHIGMEVFEDDDELAFQRCWSDLKGDRDLEGAFRPIYSPNLIDGFVIETPGFRFDFSADVTPKTRYGTIYWLPELSAKNSLLEHDIVNIGKKTIYLLGENGLLSRPLDLLGFFHEIGHMETDGDLPKNQDSITHDGFLGGRLELNLKRMAHIVQKERAANEWLIQNTSQLFTDLGVSDEQVREYCDHVQMRSYNDLVRRLFPELFEEQK